MAKKRTRGHPTRANFWVRQKSHRFQLFGDSFTSPNGIYRDYIKEMKTCFENDMECTHVLKPDAYRDLCFLSSIEKTSKEKSITMENLQFNHTEQGYKSIYYWAIYFSNILILTISILKISSICIPDIEERKLAFFATSSGIVGMPGKTFPFKVDAISRVWYERAVHSRAFAVSVYQDFFWGDLVASISKSRDSPAD